MAATNRPSPPVEIQIAADPMIIIRAEQLPRRLDLVDPHAGWFITDGSRALEKIAERLDPMFTELNLARFARMSEAMQDAARHFPQILILGAGYDTRPLWLDGLAGSSSKVFEVDFALVLDGKSAVLREHGVKQPANVISVPADLNEPGLLFALKRAGYRPDLPTAVFAENVFFFLLGSSVLRLLDPRTLQLAPGSTVTFDFWSAARINAINASLITSTGRPMFDPFPLPDDSPTLEHRLGTLGYRTVEIESLTAVAEELWPGEDHVDRLGPWRLVHLVKE